MDLNAAIDIIIKDLNEAREIIDDLKNYPGVPELQVELAKSKCKSASEVIALLKNIPVKAAQGKEEKAIMKEEIRKEKHLDKHDNVVPSPETDFKEAVEPQISEVPPIAKEIPAPPIKKPAESPIIADQFSNKSESYNEKLSSHKHEDEMLEILKTKPLSSLDEAIGINDKFLFIREIFDGNQELYNQAILKLESVGSLSDAMAIVMSYTGDKTSDGAVKQLFDLIKRKFPSNE
jgi:copper chaperone CopZ